MGVRNIFDYLLFHKNFINTGKVRYLGLVLDRGIALATLNFPDSDYPPYLTHFEVSGLFDSSSRIESIVTFMLLRDLVCKDPIRTNFFILHNLFGIGIT
jgi:hypothetical protein